MEVKQFTIILKIYWLYTIEVGLNGHLYKIEKDKNPLCRRCVNGNETVEHLLCECESLKMPRGRIVYKVLESFNNSPMSQWTYFDCLPQNRTNWEVIEGEAQ